MSLNKIIEEIKEVSKVANEDSEAGPLETLAGRRGRKKKAIETLKTLKTKYTQELLRTALFIVVTGAAKDSFSSVASDSFGCFSLDPEDFYRDLASRIPESLYIGKESASSLFDIVGRHLEDKAMEIGIVGYPMMLFKQQYRRSISSKEDFVSLIKQAINEQVGAEIIGINAASVLTDKAIKKEHGAKFTPILLTTNDEKLAIDLLPALSRLTGNVFLVAAGKASKSLKSLEGAILVKDASPETVEEALKTIKSSLRK